MRTLAQDLRFAFRMIARRPALAALTVATLGVGIAGTLVILAFGARVTGPPPFADPSRVVRVYGLGDEGGLEVASWANLSDLADVRAFHSLAIHQRTSVSYGSAESIDSATVELVSGSYFGTLGVQAAAGRMLEPRDDQAGDVRRVAVVSSAWARSRLGGTAGAVGRTIDLNGTPFVVVGVAPPVFTGSYAAPGTDIWTPLMAYDVIRPRGLDIRRRGWGWLMATARLAPGISVSQAQSEVDARTAALRRDFAPTNDALRFRVMAAAPLPEASTPVVRRALLLALALAAMALLAACANAANAQMAAVFDRDREISVRMALGAGRGRIVRQWLTESVVLTGAATLTGALVAAWVGDALGAIPLPGGADQIAPVTGVSAPLLAATAAIALVVTALFGVLPARQAAGVDLASRLRDDTGGAVGSRHRSRAQAVLVVAQIAVSMALVTSAALLARGIATARAFDLGFPVQGLTVATARLTGLDLDDAGVRAYYQDVLDRVRALPGVTAAALAATVPLGDSDERRGVEIEGYVPPDGGRGVSTNVNIVSPGYFGAMGIPVVAGRRLPGATASRATRSRPSSTPRWPGALARRLGDRARAARRRRTGGPGRRRRRRHHVLRAWRGANTVPVPAVRSAAAHRHDPARPRIGRRSGPASDDRARAPPDGAPRARVRRDELPDAARNAAGATARAALRERRLRGTRAAAGGCRHLRRAVVRGRGANPGVCRAAGSRRGARAPGRRAARPGGAMVRGRPRRGRAARRRTRTPPRQSAPRRVGGRRARSRGFGSRPAGCRRPGGMAARTPRGPHLDDRAAPALNAAPARRL
ncbi:MAG: ABC transporter permease [Vicinamibacterales bacterium]